MKQKKLTPKSEIMNKMVQELKTPLVQHFLERDVAKRAVAFTRNMVFLTCHKQLIVVGSLIFHNSRSDAETAMLYYIQHRLTSYYYYNKNWLKDPSLLELIKCVYPGLDINRPYSFHEGVDLLVKEVGSRLRDYMFTSGLITVHGVMDFFEEKGLI